MTIASQTSRISYVGDGVTATFAVPFYFQANADLVVMLQSSTGAQTTLILGTDYTVTGAGAAGGGSVHLTVTPTAATGAAISIYRDPAVTQTTSYNNNDPFPAKSHENALDKLTMLEQRTRDMVSRSLRLQDGDPVIDMHLPLLRHNTLLGFDSNNNPVAVLGPSFVGGTALGVADVSTKAVASVTVFDGSITALRTSGGTVAGDGLASTYIRGTGTGAFTDGGGVSWVPVSFTSGGAVFVASRALALTTKFAGIPAAIQTGGYYAAGDGGGALFKPAGTTPFIDAWPLTGTVVGGSLYTDGIYHGVPLNSATGIGLVATITISGGTVTTVTHATCPGNGYTVGEALTISNAFLGGTGSGFTYTIATISTPTASFTDAAGHRWQYVTDAGNFPNVNQFGAVADYAGNDVGPTNNFFFFQNALFYAGRHGAFTADGGGYAGHRVIVGQGAYLLNASPAASLIVPFGVWLEGVGGSTLKMADAYDSATHFITLGDPNSLQACFRSSLRNLTLYCKPTVTAASGIAMIYSNNVQDGGGLDNVYIYAGQRIGINFETGYGGASSVHIDTVSLNFNGASPAMRLNYGTTVINVKDLICGAPSTLNTTADTVLLLGAGMYDFCGFHTEQCPNGFLINMTGGMVSIKNATAGNGATQLVTLASTNTAGNCALERCAKNGATRLVTNGQTGGGLNRTADVLPKDGIVFFNP